MKKVILFPCLSLTIMWSCTKVVEVDLPKYKNQIVVNSLFTPDSNLIVNISTSRNINEHSPIFLDNAIVKLYKNSDFIETLSLIEEGDFISTHIPEIGAIYKLEVTYPGYDNVVASSCIPDTVDITNISFVEDAGVSEDFHVSGITITIEDPGSIDNYYEIILHDKNFSEFGSGNIVHSYPLYIHSDDLVIQSEDILNYGSAETVVFSDKLFNGKQYSLKLKCARHGLSSSNIEYQVKTLYIETRTVTEDYYKYKKKLIKYKNNDYFDIWEPGEPVQLYSNIENGLGIFAGYSTITDSISLIAD